VEPNLNPADLGCAEARTAEPAIKVRINNIFFIRLDLIS